MKYSLRAIRNNKGVTQEEAAKNIGISVETLSNYENGITYPDVPIIKRIEAYYGVGYNDIRFLTKNNDLNVTNKSLNNNNTTYRDDEDIPF